ncbi:MAG: hypothetical protein R3190_16195, partial [Thermoanaerobaculia bacterium]|nr:hypothetical protein [Thermoanaerobaculia bacterium]
NTMAALQGGGVDAILLPAHLARPLEAEGRGHILAWASDVEGWQLGALFASTRALSSRRPVLDRFLVAYRRATAVYAETFLAPAGSEGARRARELAADLTAYIPSPVEDILAGAPYIPADGSVDAESVRRHVAWMQERGLVDRRLDPAALFASAPAR